MTNDSPTRGDKLFVAFQHVIPQHAVSRFIHWATRTRFKPLKNAIISNFVRGFKPDMTEATQPDALAFATFNEFFTRTLRPEVRPVDRDPMALISPVDGTISQIGPIDGSQIIQAKGRHYSVDTLLGGLQDWSKRFAGGSFATLYLAPYNYHRIHMPLAGTLRATRFIPGRLFSVNAVTAAAVPGLFARNERVACLFEAGNVPFGMVLVGALNVGSIETVWHGEITPYGPKRVTDLPLPAERAPLHLDKGDEMGRFNMGSTVILLLPPGAAAWLPELKSGTRIKFGQRLATLR